MIVSLVPELPGGKGIPGCPPASNANSSTPSRAKEVYVVWKPAKSPSPFITETATKVFTSVDEALAHFEQAGLFAETNLFGH
jgi:adenylate kinase